jgi:hypothetical protein
VIHDQANVPQLVILGVDALGRIWMKVGPAPWTEVDRDTDE